MKKPQNWTNNAKILFSFDSQNVNREMMITFDFLQMHCNLEWDLDFVKLLLGFWVHFSKKWERLLENLSSKQRCQFDYECTSANLSLRCFKWKIFVTKSNRDINIFLKRYLIPLIRYSIYLKDSICCFLH